MSFVLQRSDLTVSEAKLISHNGQNGRENGPSDSALLQASMSRLTSDVDGLKQQCAQKDAEISSLRSQLDRAQADLLHLVSFLP